MANAAIETASRVLGDISPGTHFCLFYETKADLLSAATAYFKAGLESKDFCIWAISEPVSETEARNALRQGIPGFDRYVADRSIEILPGREWYLDDGRFDRKRIFDGWKRKLRDALGKGYKAMRVSGNAFWLGTKHANDFCAYEHELQESIVDQRMSALCTYALSATLAADVVEIARVHQFAVAMRNGDLEFIDAVKAEPLGHPLSQREREVLAWVKQGKTAQAIGELLNITTRTVNAHVRAAVRKLGANNRTEAVAIALRRRIIRH